MNLSNYRPLVLQRRRRCQWVGVPAGKWLFLRRVWLGFVSLGLSGLLGCDRAEEAAMDSATYQSQCQQQQAELRETGQQLLEDAQADAKAGNDSLLRDLDNYLLALDNHLNRARVDQRLHPDPAIQEQAGQCREHLLSLRSEWLGDASLYQLLRDQQLASEDTGEQHWLNKLLRQARHHGGHLPPDSGDVQASVVRAEANTGSRYWSGGGSVLWQRLAYSTDPAAERQVYRQQFGDDPTAAVARLVAQVNSRHQQADMLGYPNYPVLALESAMVKTPADVQQFLQQLAPLLNVNTRNPQALALWQWPGLQQLDRSDNETAPLADYLVYRQVEAGLFELTTKLFGVELLPAVGQAWHPSVRRFDVFANGQKIGQLLMDVEQRSHKYPQSGFLSLQRGVAEQQQPVGVISANLAGLDTALSPEQLTQILRAYGEFLHWLFAAEQPWGVNAGLSIETDWRGSAGWLWTHLVMRDGVLETLARNGRGQPLPDSLAQLLRQHWAEHEQRQQLLDFQLAQVSWQLYQASEPVTAEQVRQLLAPLAPEGELQAAVISHLAWLLTACDPLCYQSLWSRAMAADMYTQFADWPRIDPVVAGRWRDLMVAGSSRSGWDLLENFLRRSVSLEAFEQRLVNSPLLLED